MTIKIGICGAHGTGKTTLAIALQQKLIQEKKLSLDFLIRTTRDFWINSGVEDFEKLPPDVRSHFQNYILLNQIDKEEQAKDGFLTDRTTLDILGYTILSSDMRGASFQIFEQLVFERLQKYDVIFYLPVEFDVEAEKLRADLGSREALAEILESYIQKWASKINFQGLFGSVDSRVQKAYQSILKLNVFS